VGINLDVERERWNREDGNIVMKIYNDVEPIVLPIFESFKTELLKDAKPAKFHTMGDIMKLDDTSTFKQAAQEYMRETGSEMF